jgi:HPt (histidine-containing phosphotransfer) domain-containing protein
MLIVYENGKIIALGKNLLNTLNIALEEMSQVITQLELEMAVLNKNSIQIKNFSFKITKENLITLKNLDIFHLEKIEEFSYNEEKELSQASMDNEFNELKVLPKEEIIEALQTPEVNIIEEEEEEKPIELNFEDNISECEKIFAKKENIKEIIEKELNTAMEDLGIDQNMTDELFNDLLKQFKEKKDALYKAIEKHDYKEIHETAHFLKGASLNLRLSNLALIFKTIDEEAKKETGISIIKNLTDKFYDFISPLTNKKNTEKENQKSENKNIEIDPKIKNIVLNTIRVYLETQDEQKFQKDKKFIEKLLNTKIDSLNDLQYILKENK